MADLQAEIFQEIVSCRKCPRLFQYCQKVAQTKKKAHQTETYWSKPVPGFGDPKARLMIVGLAPAAHGALRTGRVFTGDRSGEWLYRELHAHGFSNRPDSTHANDNLKLKNAYISCVARCAPPQNKPTPKEIQNCLPYLAREIRLFSPHTRVYLALGQIALNGLWQALEIPQQPRPRFKHGEQIKLTNGKYLVMSYHPSQQNTFTGRLTRPMWSGIFLNCRELISRD